MSQDSDSLGKAQYQIAVLVEEPAFAEEVKDLENFCIETVIATLLDTPLPAHFKKIEVVVSLSGNEVVRELNRRFRDQNKPTNVLSFPSSDLCIHNYQDFPPEEILLGDIIIAYGVAKEEAKTQNKAFSDHLRHLLVHSTLHLIGYDHKIEIEAALMERLEIEILKDFGIKDPYVIED